MSVSVRTRQLRFQSTPDPEARGLPTPQGLAGERDWLRSAFATQYDAAAGSVSRVLGEHPAYRASPDTMIDAVAVRLYLSALGDGLDAVLRNGEIGPQVPFARCVAGGLGRLPCHRGATMLAVELTADQVAEIRDRRILTDWAFTQALTEPHLGLPGNVDLLIWSLTARRTRLLEPDDDYHADARAVFLPGTRFKVLHVIEPAVGVRGRLLLRELAADEPSRDHVPFDDLALSALDRAVEQWCAPGPVATVGAAAIHRFAAAPGLI